MNDKKEAPDPEPGIFVSEDRLQHLLAYAKRKNATALCAMYGEIVLQPQELLALTVVALQGFAVSTLELHPDRDAVIADAVKAYESGTASRADVVLLWFDTALNSARAELEKARGTSTAQDAGVRARPEGGVSTAEFSPELTEEERHEIVAHMRSATHDMAYKLGVDSGYFCSDCEEDPDGSSTNCAGCGRRF